MRNLTYLVSFVMVVILTSCLAFNDNWGTIPIGDASSDTTTTTTTTTVKKITYTIVFDKNDNNATGVNG